MVRLDDHDSGEHLVHSRDDVGDLLEGLLVNLADFASENRDRQNAEGHSDEQDQHQRPASGLHACVNDRGCAGENFNRAARGVRNDVRHARFNRRSVVRRAADQLSDVRLAVEADRLVDEFCENLRAQVRHDARADPAGAVVVDVRRQIFERPEQDESEAEHREELPCDFACFRFRGEGEQGGVRGGFHQLDVAFVVAQLKRGESDGAEGFVRLPDLFFDLGGLFLPGLVDEFADGFELLLFAACGLDGGDDPLRRQFLLRPGCAAGEIDSGHQARNEHQTPEQGAADDEAGDDAHRHASPVGLDIPEQTPVCLPFGFLCVIHYLSAASMVATTYSRIAVVDSG